MNPKFKKILEKYKKQKEYRRRLKKGVPLEDKIDKFAEVVRRPVKKQNRALQPTLLTKRPIPKMSPEKTPRSIKQKKKSYLRHSAVSKINANTPIPVPKIPDKQPIPIPKSHRNQPTPIPSRVNPKEPVLVGHREPKAPILVPQIDEKQPIPMPSKIDPKEPILLGHKRPKTELSEAKTELLPEILPPPDEAKKQEKQEKQEKIKKVEEAKKQEKIKEIKKLNAPKRPYTLGPGLLDLLHELVRKR